VVLLIPVVATLTGLAVGLAAARVALAAILALSFGRDRI
jgi:hypothetical protein